MITTQHGILGQATDYPKDYSPNILYPIARQLGRQSLGCFEWLGYDMWYAYEVSWLDDKGIPKVAIARFIIPANSPNIIESKSFKLYLNGLNFSRFADTNALIELLQADLSQCAGVDVCVQLIELDRALGVDALGGVCIDDSLNEAGYEQDDDIAVHHLMRHTHETDKAGERLYHLHSHLLRSNCPVTNQPDWGSVEIILTSDKRVDYGDVLRYILSYRHHNGFHEQCVERLYADFKAAYAPSSLLVRAQYTRRGGLDINPVRASDEALLAQCGYLRLNRQ